MKTQHLHHKHGGTITAIHAVGHKTYKGVAGWHFIGDVTWGDGSGESKDREIAPWAVCYDREGSEAAKTEGDAVHAAMTDYLNTAGHWHEQKEARDGTMYSWTPMTPNGRKELP